MLLVFNVDGREWRTMHAGDVARCMEFADDAASVSHRMSGTRPAARGREWVDAFRRKAVTLGYRLAKAVQVCTCCTLNLVHSPECGLVMHAGNFPTYFPPLPDDLPLIAIPFEWPAWKWKPLRTPRPPVKDTGSLRNSIAYVDEPGTVVVDGSPYYGIPESDPDRIEV